MSADAPASAVGPIFLVIYGPPGLGKTLQMIRTFWYGLFFGEEGSDKPAISACGFTGPVLGQYPIRMERLPAPFGIGRRPDTLMDLNIWIQQVAEWCLANGHPFPFHAFLFDEWHNLCARTDAVLSTQCPPGRSGEKNVFWLHRRYNEELNLFYGLARALGICVCVNLHQRDAVFRGATLDKQGGPLVTTRNHARSLIGRADTVLHAIHDPMSLDPLCAAAYAVNPMGAEDPYPTKDRHVIGRLRHLPASLREILLACRGHGYERYLPRPPGLECLDDMTEQVSAQLTSGAGDLTALRSGWIALKNETSWAAQVDWAISDGIARYQLQKGLRDLATSSLNINLGGSSAAGSLILPSLPPPPPKA